MASTREQRPTSEALTENPAGASRNMITVPTVTGRQAPAAIVLDGDDDDQLRVTAWSNGDDGFFRFEVYYEPTDDDEPVAIIDISPAGAMNLALALAGTASKYIGGGR